MAVDYTKMLITGIDIKRLFSLPELDFKSHISKTTGEINESVFIAEYRFCKIKILNANSENPIVLFTGSIHKLWNDKHKILAPNYEPNKPYNGYNGNLFTLNDVIEVREHLEDLFNCKASQMVFQSIEFGVNVELNYKPLFFLKGLLYHRNIMFEFGHNGNNSQAIHNYYIFKIYCKSYQFSMTENVIRFELKILKMEELRIKHIDIITFEDINKNTLDKALKLLLKRFDEIRHYDYSIDKKKLTKCELNAVQNYSNPRYWINDLEPNKRHRHLKKLDSITTKFSKNMFQKTRIEIDKKCITVNQVFDNKTKEEIDKKCSTFNRVIENQFCSTDNPLVKQLTVLQTTIQKEIENEPKNDEVNSLICKVTGLSLKGQKSGSHFLSHTGLKLLFENDRLKFDFVLQKHLPKQYKNSDLETQIIQTAKSIRTKDCVANIKATRLYPQHQPQLFG